MALRFQKRIKIAPGVRLNISKSTLSVTAGIKGASVNVGKDGKHLNLGAPGTGLSTRTRIGVKPDRNPEISDQQDPTKLGLGSVIVGTLVLAGIAWGIWTALT